MEEIQKADAKKIVVLGLDNSGKTSIVLCLKGANSLPLFTSPNPTRGILIEKFQTLGLKFSIWDFGGQEQFRNNYLKKFHDHIRGVDKMIYVIDIQDVERFDLSLKYLIKIMESLQTSKLFFDFSIFLHKYDQDFENSEKFNNKAVLNLIGKIKDIIPRTIPYQIFKSSIYAMFQKIEIS